MLLYIPFHVAQWALHGRAVGHPHSEGKNKLLGVYHVSYVFSSTELRIISTAWWWHTNCSCLLNFFQGFLPINKSLALSAIDLDSVPTSVKVWSVWAVIGILRCLGRHNKNKVPNLLPANSAAIHVSFIPHCRGKTLLFTKTVFQIIQLGLVWLRRKDTKKRITGYRQRRSRMFCGDNIPYTELGQPDWLSGNGASLTVQLLVDSWSLVNHCNRDMT